jgi:hypothetical protein
MGKLCTGVDLGGMWRDLVVGDLPHSVPEHDMLVGQREKREVGHGPML